MRRRTALISVYVDADSDAEAIERACAYANSLRHLRGDGIAGHLEILFVAAITPDLTAAFLGRALEIIDADPHHRGLWEGC